jgi:hypothetical protein
MDKRFNFFSAAFDSIHDLWENETTHRFVSASLVVVFLLSLAVIETNRQGWLPDSLSTRISLSHYQAINLAFSFVLILEVISLIFALPGSMSKAIGKQFEILALIFLRTAFKELSKLPVPIDISAHPDVLWNILTYGSAAITIFALLGVFFLVRQNLDEALASGQTLDLFIKVKKTVAFFMVIIFFILGSYDVWLMMIGQPQFEFFHYFYTILIFNDILLVLIAQIFLPQFSAVFRNSGYAFATLLIRLSLTAPIYYNVLIGVCSILFAIILTLVYNHFFMKYNN